MFVHLTAVVTRDGDAYVARCLDVEVASHGSTVEEALAHLTEALELYFEDEPPPAASQHPLVASIDIKVPAQA